MRKPFTASSPSPKASHPRLVVVTGASSGIGRATAHQLARRGDRLVLMARSTASLAEVAHECVSAGASAAEAVQVDVADASAVSNVMDDVGKRHGPVDAVVQCAGLAGYGRIEDIPAEVFEAVIHTNLFGSANVARSVLPGMRARNSGVLVFVGSVIGHIAVPRMTPYVVSKWGIRSLARQLQIDNRDRSGVHVCLVEPGSVDTPIYVQAATYQGRTGRPPPPVVRPERVARAIADVLDRPRKQVDVGAANWLLKVGFTCVPALYDALVGPLYWLAATDTHPTGATAGNALIPVERNERLYGEQTGTGRALLARLAATAAAARRRRAGVGT